jgi:serine acetyltransferase
LGAESVDETSEEYTQGENAAIVASFFAPGPGGKTGALAKVSKYFRRNIFNVIPAKGSNIGRGFQIAHGRFIYMKHAGHGHGHPHYLPHHQIVIGKRFVIRHVIGTRIWKWTKGPF